MSFYTSNAYQLASLDDLVSELNHDPQGYDSDNGDVQQSVMTEEFTIETEPKWDAPEWNLEFYDLYARYLALKKDTPSK